MTKRHAHIQHVDVHTEDTYEHKKGKFDTPAGVCGTVGPCTSGADKKECMQHAEMQRIRTHWRAQVCVIRKQKKVIFEA